MAKTTNDKINPVVISNSETGDTYTLEFNRESVKFAERMGFDMDDLDRKPLTAATDLFFYAFRMHHRNISRQKVEEILYDDLGGMPDGLLVQLAKLYSVPFESLISNEESAKNSKMVVKF